MSVKFKKRFDCLLPGLFVLALFCVYSPAKSEIKAEHNLAKAEIIKAEKVDALKKKQFEDKFAMQCVENEIKNSVNKELDRKRFTKPCSCIAKRMMMNLSAVDAEKFLVENKSTQSLMMDFDKAAFFCVQNKPRPKAKVLFGRN
ncbi:MAG: hypothetical protein ACKE51_04560 [Methylococcaceae bacterium]